MIARQPQINPRTYSQFQRAFVQREIQHMTAGLPVVRQKMRVAARHIDALHKVRHAEAHDGPAAAPQFNTD